MNKFSYDTLTEALADLAERGFVNNFNLKPDCIECKELGLQFKPLDFEIVEFYRFEGNSDPGDEEVVYAVEAKDGTKGVLVDAFGPYADEISPEILKKLNIER